MSLLQSQRGFTLIEIIVVMIVLGIMALMGSFGLERAMDGYNLAQANSESTQKAQNALDRITIELSHITTYDSVSSSYKIIAGTANSITYTANFGGANETHTIDQDANLVRYYNNSALPLTDRVVTNGLQLTYFKGDGTTVVPPLNAGTIPLIRLIGIALPIQVIPGVTRTYNARVALQR